MADWSHLRERRIVRLNARLFPVHPYEAARHEAFGLRPEQIEANTPKELIAALQDCEGVFIVSTSLPAEVIQAMERCRVISRLGIGTDKIDVAEATRQGIVVTNVPTFCTDEMGDHAMALILALARQLPAMSAALREGAWTRARRQANSGRRLSVQTLGLIGFGDSGVATARRARAFGMRVLATRRDRNASRDTADALGVEMVSLERLLAESDYVSLHLPLNKETYHLLDEGRLRQMKPGAYLINTARGEITDEIALAHLLREGHLAGAGIDTFEHINPFDEDERPPKHPLLELDNVILTPHVAGLSVEAKQDVARGGVENLVSILCGQWPRPEHIVNAGVAPRIPLEEYDDALFAEMREAES